MSELKVGGRYNWKNQPERLFYMGLSLPSPNRWHQFSLVDKPGEVWCEVAPGDLHMIEESEPEPVRFGGRSAARIHIAADRIKELEDDAEYDKSIIATLRARVAKLEDEKTEWQNMEASYVQTIQAYNNSEEDNNNELSSLRATMTLMRGQANDDETELKRVKNCYMGLWDEWQLAKTNVERLTKEKREALQQIFELGVIVERLTADLTEADAAVEWAAPREGEYYHCVCCTHPIPYKDIVQAIAKLRAKEQL